MVQFRKSKSFGPIRLTASKRGLGVSVGAGPLRVSRGADGKVRRTVRVPGAGIYDTKVIGGSTKKQPAAASKAVKSATPKKEYSSTTNGFCGIALALMIGIPSINAGFVIGIVVAGVILLGGIALLFDNSDSGQPGKPRLPTKEGWYPDPYRAERERYWTGAEWSSKSR